MEQARLISNDKSVSIDCWLSALQGDTDVGGLSVCIRDNKGVIFNKAYGVHDKISGAPLKKDAIFPVASQTKTFTAVALLKLVLDGKMGLEDKLVSYLPQFSHPLLDQVTLRDALSHQTRFVPGFSGDDDEASFSTPGSGDDDEASLSADELRALDITTAKFSDENEYSNDMYSLLGLIIEDVSGMPYREYVRKEVIEKHNLGEIYTGLDAVPKTKRRRIPAGYQNGEEAPFYDFGGEMPCGGFLATPEAITNFYHKLLSCQILPPATVKLMTTAINDTCGLGVFSMPCKTGAVIGHSGSLAGQVCVTAHDTRHGLTVAVTRTSNDFDEDSSEEDRKKDEITAPERILCKVLKTLLERPARARKDLLKQGRR
jgi:D-alanyl-D-alanine carboxypeptidase